MNNITTNYSTDNESLLQIEETIKDLQEKYNNCEKKEIKI